MRVVVLRPFALGVVILVLLESVPIARAASPGNDAVLMLDMSMGETEHDPIIRTLSAGARVAATELKSEDRVSLVEFSSNAKTVLPLTGDRRKFEAALRHAGRLVVQHGQHHLYDSVLTAINIFPNDEQPARRRCVVVVTASGDAGSKHSAEEITLAAKRKGAVIFVALVSPSHSLGQSGPGRQMHPNSSTASADDGRKTLEPLARGTGGDIRLYEANQYAIARAISEMVNK